MGVRKKAPLKKDPQNVRKGHLTHLELEASNYVSYVSQYTARPAATLKNMLYLAARVHVALYTALC